MNINDELIQKIIDTKSICVDFQPIYSFNTKKVIGLEALFEDSLKMSLFPRISFSTMQKITAKRSDLTGSAVKKQ